MHRRGGMSGVALLTAVAALVMAAGALARIDGSGGATGGGAKEVTVGLGELFIKPAVTSAPAGNAHLKIVNGGSVDHSMGIAGTDKTTPVLSPRSSATLDLSDLPAGDYQF